MQVNSGKLSQEQESPQATAAFTTLGLQSRVHTRRASRSYADLYALASLQQRPSGLQPKKKQSIQMRKTSNSMDDHYKLPYNIQISCESENSSLKANNHQVVNECRPSQSFDRDMSRLNRGYDIRKQGQSTLALHKISVGSCSPRPISPEWHNVPLTKGYLNAANRHLAASTLRLWQGSSCGGSSTLLGEINKAKRKTKSVYNLKDCIV